MLSARLDAFRCSVAQLEQAEEELQRKLRDIRACLSHCRLLFLAAERLMGLNAALAHDRAVGVKPTLVRGKASVGVCRSVGVWVGGRVCGGGGGGVVGGRGEGEGGCTRSRRVHAAGLGGRRMQRVGVTRAHCLVSRTWLSA